MALHYYTRAEQRDIIRRILGKTPLVDVTPPGEVIDINQIGEPFMSQPRPSNAAINDALDRATMTIASECDWKLNTSASLTLPGNPGGMSWLSIPLESFAAVTPVAGFVQSIRRVTWSYPQGQPIIVVPKPREEFDRDGIAIDSYSAATPIWYWVEGYTLYIAPQPSSQGTIGIVAGVAPHGFTSDADTLAVDEINVTSQLLWCVCAALKWAETQTQDQEMVDRSTSLRAEYARLLTLFKGWWQKDVQRQAQPQLGFATYRRGQGLQTILNG